MLIAGPTVAGQQVDHWKLAIASKVDGILTDYALELQEVLRSQ